MLQDVYQAGGDNGFAFAISLAYPVSDIVVGALALLLISRLVTDRLPMALLSGGLIAMGIADGGFTYLSTAGTYQTGSIIDVGWVSAFLLCAVAAVVGLLRRGGLRLAGQGHAGRSVPAAAAAVDRHGA